MDHLFGIHWLIHIDQFAPIIQITDQIIILRLTACDFSLFPIVLNLQRIPNPIPTFRQKKKSVCSIFRQIFIQNQPLPFFFQHRLKRLPKFFQHPSPPLQISVIHKTTSTAASFSRSRPQRHIQKLLTSRVLCCRQTDFIAQQCNSFIRDFYRLRV